MDWPSARLGQNAVKVLITGGSGYLGGRIKNYLAENGYNVVFSSRNKNLKSNPAMNLSFVYIDWDSEGSIAQACQDVDVIVHAAGFNADACIKNRSKALNFNKITSSNFANIASKSGVGRFIFLSTAHVYGSPLMGYFDENSKTRNTHPYALSKLAGEKGVIKEASRSKMNATIFRLSNCMGTPVKFDVNCWHLVTNDLCLQALKTRSMIIKKSNVERRNFITIQDLNEIIGEVLKRSHEDVFNGIFNVGGQWSPTIYELARCISVQCKRLFGFQPSLLVNSAVKVSQAPALHYSIDRLLKTGIVLNNEYAGSINDLLLFCENKFSNDS